MVVGMDVFLSTHVCILDIRCRRLVFDDDYDIEDLGGGGCWLRR